MYSRLIPGLLTLIVSGCSLTPWAPDPVIDKPNVLVIVLDDLGYNDLAMNNNNTDMHTPSMDRLAAQGVRYTRHYATAMCSPARASLLTGLYPERLGNWAGGVSPQLVTLPEQLRSAGYQTRFFGKWHIGEPWQRGAWPDRQGFDEWLGYLNQDYLAGRRGEDGRLEVSFPRYENPWLMGTGGPGAFYEGHVDDIMTDRAMEAISEMGTASRPWFTYLAYFAPHHPYEASAEFAALYPGDEAGQYRALVHQLDSNIGRLLGHLEDIGALGNTLVVVVSDNGGTNKVMDNNAPFQGRKGWITEGGTRTPLIIRWPDEAKNGRTVDEIVSIEDIYPSILEALAVALPGELDGKSFYRESQPEVKVWNHLPYKHAVLSEDGRYRYDSAWGKTALYDFAADPAGSVQVDNVELAREMEATYVSWAKEVELVDTNYENGLLTGMDFVRTPGDGKFTLGLAIDQDDAGQLVRQGNGYSIFRNGDVVKVSLGELSLSGQIGPPAECHSIVLRGVFLRRTQFQVPEERYRLSLFVDGELLDEKVAEGSVSIDPHEPTWVVNDSAMILSGMVAEDTPWTVQGLSRQLCGA